MTTNLEQVIRNAMVPVVIRTELDYKSNKMTDWESIIKEFVTTVCHQMTDGSYESEKN